MFGSRALGFSREDEITITFCGSKKSLASGVPMASVIFAGQPIGAIVLPLMLFHQIQLMACAVIAQKYADAAKRKTEAQPGRGGTLAADGGCGDAGLTITINPGHKKGGAPQDAAFLILSRLI